MLNTKELTEPVTYPDASYSLPRTSSRPRLMIAGPISMAVGNIVEFLGTIVGVTLAYEATIVPDGLTTTLFLILSWLCLWFFPHCLSHYVAGRLLGIRFRYYYVGRSNMVNLSLPVVSSFSPLLLTMGIKTDKESMIRSSPEAKAIMYRVGPIASMTAPLIPLFYAFYSGFLAQSLILFIITIANAAFTLYYSPRAGDFAKARRVLGS